MAKQRLELLLPSGWKGVKSERSDPAMRLKEQLQKLFPEDEDESDFYLGVGTQTDVETRFAIHGPVDALFDLVEPTLSRSEIAKKGSVTKHYGPLKKSAFVRLTWQDGGWKEVESQGKRPAAKKKTATKKTAKKKAKKAAAKKPTLAEARKLAKSNRYDFREKGLRMLVDLGRDDEVVKLVMKESRAGIVEKAMTWLYPAPVELVVRYATRPRPAPLKITTLSREDRGEYVLERFEFHNGVDALIPGILLIPKRRDGRIPELQQPPDFDGLLHRHVRAVGIGVDRAAVAKRLGNHGDQFPGSALHLIDALHPPADLELHRPGLDLLDRSDDSAQRLFGAEMPVVVGDIKPDLLAPPAAQQIRRRALRHLAQQFENCKLSGGHRDPKQLALHLVVTAGTTSQIDVVDQPIEIAGILAHQEFRHDLDKHREAQCHQFRMAHRPTLGSLLRACADKPVSAPLEQVERLDDYRFRQKLLPQKRTPRADRIHGCRETGAAT